MIKQIVKHFQEKEVEYSESMKAAFDYYVKNVSNPAMAASLKSCIFLACMYEVLKPHNILDLGSGISSYTLRYFKKVFNSPAKIISVDSDVNWLAKSKQFCHELDVNTEHFYHWSEMEKKIPCELIFMDIDKTKFRINYYNPVCKRFTVKGSMMLVDDMHKPVLRQAVKKITVPHNVYTLNKETKHKKRYNWVLEFTGKK